MIEAADDFRCREAKQLVPLDGFAKTRRAIPCIDVLSRRRRQFLQQHSGGLMRIRSQPESGLQLLGFRHVVLQYFGNAVAFQADDSLIGLRAARRYDGNNEAPLAEQRANISLGQFTFPFRRRAQCVIAGCFHHQQLHRTAALYLHDQRAFKFESGRQQCGCRHHFAQQTLKRCRVATPLQDCAPCSIQMCDFAAYRCTLEQEALQGIAHDFRYNRKRSTLSPGRRPSHTNCHVLPGSLGDSH